MSMNDPRLRFPFDLEKMAEAVAYFDEKQVPGLTLLKVLKLLYLADRKHLLKYSRPIVGGQYVLMEQGPVALETYDLIGDAIGGSELDSADGQRLSDAVHVKWTSGYQYPLLKRRRPARRDVFSESDLETLDEVIEEFGDRTARELVNLVHEHATCKKPNTKGRKSDILYAWFFADEASNEARAALRLAAIEQDDRDVTEALDTDQRAIAG